MQTEGMRLIMHYEYAQKAIWFGRVHGNGEAALSAYSHVSVHQLGGIRSTIYSEGLRGSLNSIDFLFF
jgi:hypothetical protein